MALVEIIDCEEAGEFLDCLAPRGRLFCGHETVGSMRSGTDAWLYRGHSDDDNYALIPSALRSPTSFAAMRLDICETNRSQLQAEARTLQRFFDLADSTGLPLPEDSQALRALIHEVQTEAYTDSLNSGNGIWPPRPLWSLLGIAQHYGIPTRLLDWSHKALPAAYFAARGAVTRLSAAATRMRQVFGVSPSAGLEAFAQRLSLDEPSPAFDSNREAKVAALGEYRRLMEEKLSVWAFAYGKFSALFRAPYGPTRTQQIAKVTAPHSQNPNLHAQDGLFTLHLASFRDRLDEPVDRTALDTVIGQVLATLATRGLSCADQRYFYRVRLPLSRAGQLMWLLAKEGISAATIYPGYKGVVMALEEESAGESQVSPAAGSQ